MRIFSALASTSPTSTPPSCVKRIQSPYFVMSAQEFPHDEQHDVEQGKAKSFKCVHIHYELREFGGRADDRFAAATQVEVPQSIK